MSAVNFTDFRRNHASHLDQVCDDHDPLVVTRRKGRSAVVISQSDYDSLVETSYLLQNPKNAEMLRRSIAEINAGRGQVRDLIE